jgi:hypothetical protein
MPPAATTCARTRARDLATRSPDCPGHCRGRGWGRRRRLRTHNSFSPSISLSSSSPFRALSIREGLRTCWPDRHEALAAHGPRRAGHQAAAAAEGGHHLLCVFLSSLSLSLSLSLLRLFWFAGTLSRGGRMRRFYGEVGAMEWCGEWCGVVCRAKDEEGGAEEKERERREERREGGENRNKSTSLPRSPLSHTHSCTSSPPPKAPTLVEQHIR